MTKKDSSLQSKLQKKITEAGISAHSLEKKAGLKRSAVQNILYGKSKKPSAEIIRAITKVLGCSINDLLGPHDYEVPSDSSYPRQIGSDSHMDSSVLNTDLYAKAVQTANHIFQVNQITASKQDALNFIDEIYQYSLNNKKLDIDLEFAEWLARKMLAGKIII